MGFWDSKWIVEFEVSKGVFSSNKRGTLVVEASSEYSAKDKAKGLLKVDYSYVKILSAHKSGGREEERKATFSPTVTITEKQIMHSESKPQRELSPEERELLLEQMRQKEAVKKQKEKLNEVERKAKAVKKAAVYHIRMAIISGIISLVAFLFGWIPHWISLFKVAASKSQLQMWIELGHSESDATGQEFADDIAKYTKEANSVLWIPFVILGIGIIVTILVFLVSRGKTQSKVDKASEDLKSTVREYEETYGEIGSLSSK